MLTKKPAVLTWPSCLQADCCNLSFSASEATGDSKQCKQKQNQMCYHNTKSMMQRGTSIFCLIGLF